MPLALLDRVRGIDDPWSVAVARARPAGKRLARLLLDGGGAAGDAPATLVGYARPSGEIPLIGPGVATSCARTISPPLQESSKDVSSKFLRIERTAAAAAAM